jgi:hypothetical protein
VIVRMSDINDRLSRRPGYYIPKKDGTFDVKVFSRPFDRDNSAEFVELIKIAIDLQPILRALEIAELSYREIYTSIDWVNRRLPSMHETHLSGVPLIYDVQVLMLHRVMAFLSSCRSFLDHTETALSRLHGKPSSKLEAFKGHTRRLFDTNFSYRFLDGLRNMSQHVTLPISACRIIMQRADNTGEASYGVSLIMDRAKLLEAWSNWKSVVKRELEQQPAEFDLLPLLDEQIEWLRELSCACFALHASEIRECIDYLSALFRIVKAPPGAVPVLWVGEATDPNNPPPRWELPPFEDIRRITDIMGWWP